MFDHESAHVVPHLYRRCERCTPLHNMEAQLHDNQRCLSNCTVCDSFALRRKFAETEDESLVGAGFDGDRSGIQASSSIRSLVVNVCEAGCVTEAISSCSQLESRLQNILMHCTSLLLYPWRPVN